MGNIYFREVPTQEDYNAALKIGLLRSTVDRRLMDGWTLADAITKPSINKTLSERKKMLLLAQKNGISETAFLKRIKRGFTQYDAATTKKHGKPVRKKKTMEIEVLD